MHYWKRIDTAQQAGQVALFKKNADAIYAAVQKSGALPTSYDAIGIAPPDYQGIGAPEGFRGVTGTSVFAPIWVNSISLCSAINVANGGPPIYDRFHGQDYDRSQGCGGADNTLRAWVRVDPAFVAQQTSYVINLATALDASIAANGGPGSQTAIAAGTALMVAGNKTNFMSFSGVYNYASNPNRYVSIMVVQSEAVCAAISASYGGTYQGRYRGADYYQPGGCGGNGDGNLYYWRQL